MKTLCLSMKRLRRSSEYFPSRFLASRDLPCSVAFESSTETEDPFLSFQLNYFVAVAAHRTWPSAQNHRASHQFDDFVFRLDQVLVLDCYCHHCCATTWVKLELISDENAMQDQMERTIERRSHVACLAAIALDRFLKRESERETKEREIFA